MGPGPPISHIIDVCDNVAQTVLPCFTAHVPEMRIKVMLGSEIDTGGERRLILPTGLLWVFSHFGQE